MMKKIRVGSRKYRRGAALVGGIFDWLSRLFSAAACHLILAL